MNANVDEAKAFKEEVGYLANTSFAIDAVADSFQKLNSYLTDLTDAMAAQQVVETQLLWDKDATPAAMPDGLSKEERLTRLVRRLRRG